MLLARCTEPSAASAAFCFRQAKNSDSAFRLPLCPGMGKPMENHRLHGDFMGKTHGLIDFGGLETINQWIING